MKTLTKMQKKFNTAMLSGKLLSIAQIRTIGFANPYDAAYQARDVHGINVRRMKVKARNNRTFSAYYLVK